MHLVLKWLCPAPVDPLLVMQSRGHTLSTLNTGHPPAGHWTKKFNHLSNLVLHRTQREEFASIRDVVAAFMHTFQEKYRIGGYMEAEHVVRYALPKTASKSFVEGIAVPFTLVTTGSMTKEADLHLAFGEDVDPRLIQQLTGAGLYTVLMPEGEGVKFVLTAQGTTGQITSLMKALLGHLGTVGGAGMHASAKMEIVDRIERASDSVEISEVIESIHWVAPS